MSQPLQIHLRYLPMPLQRAIEQFAGLPGRHRTGSRLASLVACHLEAGGMSGDTRREHWLSSAFAIARLRFGIDAERRAGPPGRGHTA